MDLRWKAGSGNNPRLLMVVWKEHDGPAVKPSQAAGFGSRLITGSISGATVQYEFLAKGVQRTIDIPLPPEG